ncbi:Apolipo O [Cordyceps militaris]|uniref:MICOS complex subunit n=1 Tax=Cordyceps militaris TaxID=73501 RepID=A0A2H4S9U0_CORMI|nr:Apolipo O [Cordyceps militaris]
MQPDYLKLPLPKLETPAKLCEERETPGSGQCALADRNDASFLTTNPARSRSSIPTTNNGGSSPLAKARSGGCCPWCCSPHARNGSGRGTRRGQGTMMNTRPPPFSCFRVAAAAAHRSLPGAGGSARNPRQPQPRSLTFSSSQRKPIYDDFEALPTAPSAPNAAPPATAPARETSSDRDDTPLAVVRKPRGPTPTDQLAVQIGKGRLALYRLAVAGEDRVNEAMDCAFGLEQSFTRTLASLAPARASGEKLMPGAIYVLVAAMAGSIVARNRNVLLRAAAPLAFGVGAGWAVLPVTMRNVADLSWKYEQRFPAVRDTHLQIREGIEKGASFARVHARLGVRLVDEKVTDVREIVEGWVKQGK